MADGQEHADAIAIGKHFERREGVASLLVQAFPEVSFDYRYGVLLVGGERGDFVPRH
jgi:hypothetical protein